MNRKKQTRGLVFLLILTIILIPLNSFSSDNTLEDCDTESDMCEINTNIKDDSSLNIINKEKLDSEPLHHDENKICLAYFYSKTCSHCNALKPFLKKIEKKYKDEVIFHSLDVAEYENYHLYNEFCTGKDYTGKEIPLLIIGDDFFVGEEKIRNNLEDSIEKLINAPKENKTCPFSQKLCVSDNKDSEKIVDKITYSAIFIAGLIDGVNPCAFAVLLFLMTILFEMSGSKKRIAKVGISYIIAFLLTNISMGLLVYWFSDLVFGGTSITLKIAATVALMAGIINVKDFFWYGKGISLKIPESTKKIYKPLIMKGSVPACILLGIIIAIFEAPCSASIYYAVIEMLRTKTTTLLQALPFLLIYNFMFILPLIVVFMLVYFEKNIETMEKWRKSKRKWMKLAMGIILIIFSLAVFFNII